MNIYVGNLPFEIDDEQLETTFSPYGEVTDATVVLDRMTNRSRGFGFVEMPDSAAAGSAVSSLNGADLAGRPLTVNEARPREDRR